MNRKTIVSIILPLLCLLLLLPTSVYAQTAPSFLLTANNPVEGEMTITMSGKNITDLYAYEARLTFDPSMLELVEAKSNLEGFSVSPIIKDNEIILAHTKIGNVTGESGDILIGTLIFKTKKYGKSIVEWTSLETVNHNLTGQTYSIKESVSVNTAKKGFVDLEGHWAKADIELLASKGIIEGMDEEHFVPEAHVTRAQFAAMISRTLKFQTSTKENPFTDVSSDSWYNDVVNRAFAAGVIQGMTETSFAPDRNITREEMAAMIVRASNYASGSETGESHESDLQTFADSEATSEWAREDIQTAVRLGIINGREENRFVPKDQATRAEAAVVMKRLLLSLSLL